MPPRNPGAPEYEGGGGHAGLGFVQGRRDDEQDAPASNRERYSATGDTSCKNI